MEIFDKLVRGIKNPQRVIYRYKEKLTKKNNEESLLGGSIRYFPSKSPARKIFFVKSQFDYGDKARGLSFEENNFLHTLINSGYEVMAFDPLFLMEKYGRKLMNRILIEGVYRWQPDLVFFVLFKDEIEIDTLLEIRDTMRIKTVNWFCDDQWRFESFSSCYAPHLSCAVTTDPQAVAKYKSIGCDNVILSQWACNHFLYKHFDLPYKFDVTFVGQPHGDRAKVIKEIKAAGVNVETFGFGWPKGRVSTYEMVKIFNQSKINLNLSNASRGQVIQIKGRDFEIPGCGGFMITCHSKYISDYFAIGKEIVTYADTADLVEKIKYYLTEDKQREEIRKQGYSKALGKHTYTIRFSEIFNILIG